MNKFSTVIGRRLLSYLLAFSFMTALAAFALILNSDYERSLNSYDQSVVQIRNSYQQSISYSLWNFDYRQIEAQLLGILNFPGVVYVFIENQDEVLHSAGDAYSHSDQHFDFPLDYESAGQSYHLGSLHISIDHTELHEELKEKAINILGIQFVKTFSIAVFILVIVHSLITRRLAQMADWARKFHLNNLDTPLDTGSSSANNDEISMVTEAVNDMRERIRQDLALQKKSRSEIENVKEQLSIAINNAAIGFCTYHVDHDQLVGNAHFASQLGITEYELENLAHPVDALLERIQGTEAIQQRERINQLLLGRLNRVQDSFEMRNFREETRYLDITFQITRYEDTRPQQILICVTDRTRESAALAKARDLAVSLENKVTQRTEELYTEQQRARATIRQLEHELDRNQSVEQATQQQKINELLLRQFRFITEDYPTLDDNKALTAIREYLEVSATDAHDSLNLTSCVRHWAEAANLGDTLLELRLPFSLIIEENPDLLAFLFRYIILSDPALSNTEKLTIGLRLAGDKVEFSAEYQLRDTSGLVADITYTDISELCQQVIAMRFNGRVEQHEDNEQLLRKTYTLAMRHL